jgi:hypothetical protein
MCVPARSLVAGTWLDLSALGLGFFGELDCGFRSAGRGLSFVGFYTIAYWGTAKLLRYAEGAVSIAFGS